MGLECTGVHFTNIFSSNNEIYVNPEYDKSNTKTAYLVSRAKHAAIWNQISIEFELWMKICH